MVNKIDYSDARKSQIMANIEEAWSLCSADDITNGWAWYPLAGDMSRMLGNGDLEFGAAYVAALSPMLDWDTNVKLAFAHWRGEFGGCLGSRKAVKIIEGGDVHTLMVPNGARKTFNFWHNIMRPMDANFVTIDRHAWALATRTPYTSLGDKEYDFLADAYKQVAAKLGVPPSVLQAATWVWWRRAGQAQFLPESGRKVKALAA